MSSERTEPYYSTVSQPDMDTLREIVARVGYAPIIWALGDILTQTIGKKNAGDLSFDLGIACATAQTVDSRFPPPTVIAGTS